MAYIKKDCGTQSTHFPPSLAQVVPFTLGRLHPKLNTIDCIYIVQFFGPSRVSVSQKKMERAFYFTVFVGRRPGVYSLWTEFEEQIKGFEGYRYEIYLTEAAAVRAFNKYCMTTGSVEPIEVPETRYFVVYDGVNPGVYSSWAKAEKQMHGDHAPRYGVFRT